MSFAEQLTRLRDFLDADDLHEEALDYVAAHGYLTALSICPEEVPEREWIDALFAEPPQYRDAAQQEEIERSLVQLKAHILRVLGSDEELDLPCDLDLGPEPDDSELRMKQAAARSRKGVVGSKGRKAPMMPRATLSQPRPSSR